MPKNATTDPDSGLRTYRWRGRDLLSVTSLRRTLGLPFNLHGWTINQTIDAAIELVPHPRPDDDASMIVLRKAIRALSMTKRDTSANLGSRVHAAADAHTTIADAEEDVRPFLRQFYDAKDTLRMGIVRSESQVFNLTLGYAGSLDILGRITPPGEAEYLALMDIKTGSGLYIDHLLQVLAYSHAEFIGKDDVIDVEGTKALLSTQGIGILHLQPECWEWVELRVSQGAIDAFADMVRLANWMHANEDLTVHQTTVVTGKA